MINYEKTHTTQVAVKNDPGECVYMFFVVINIAIRGQYEKCGWCVKVLQSGDVIVGFQTSESLPTSFNFYRNFYRSGFLRSLTAVLFFFSKLCQSELFVGENKTVVFLYQSQRNRYIQWKPVTVCQKHCHKNGDKCGRNDLLGFAIILSLLAGCEAVCSQRNYQYTVKDWGDKSAALIPHETQVQLKPIWIEPNPVGIFIQVYFCCFARATNLPVTTRNDLLAVAQQRNTVFPPTHTLPHLVPLAQTIKTSNWSNTFFLKQLLYRKNKPTSTVHALCKHVLYM